MRSVVLLMGAPGSGKGTQGPSLARRFGLHHLSAGEALRRARDVPGPRGDTIRARDARGEPLPGELVLEVLAAAWAEGGGAPRPILLDGFPRNLENLAALLVRPELRMAGALLLDCPVPVLRERLAGRAETSERWDDKLAGPVDRLATYMDSTRPAVEALERLGLLARVDGTGTVEEVRARCEDALEGLGLARAVRPSFRIVFTGGPCGGKTTAIARLARRLESLGFAVYRVPEAAGLALTGGATLAGLEPAGLVDFEGALLDMVCGLEASFERLAEADGGAAVLLCDRGTMDVAAHLGPGEWERLLARRRGRTAASLCEARYDAVVHLVSTAVDAPEAYRLEGNPARSAGLAWARELDRRCAAAWARHPRRIEIGSSRAGLDERLERVEEAVLDLLEERLPGPLPLRVLATAEPFGFGPTAAVAQLFPVLRGRVARLDFAGAGHTRDLQTPLAWDAVYALEGADPDAWARDLAARARQYDAVLVSCDLAAARAVREAGVPYAFYDPLAWYWSAIPEELLRADLYLCQDFFGVRERVAGLDFRSVAVVPPLVPEGLAGAGARAGAVINLGGLKNPLLSEAVAEGYAARLAGILAPLAERQGHAVTILTGATTAGRLAAAHPSATTVPPDEAQRRLGAAALAVMTPGLGNIYEAAALARRVFWLPPANDSQGRQLALLREKGLAPFSADWHELLEGMSPLDYRAPQAEVMAAIAGAVARAGREPAFEARLGARFEQACRADEAAKDPLPALLERFGRGGDRIAANLVLRRLLGPMARRRAGAGPG